MKKLLFLSIAITFFLLHFEGARMVLFDVPIYFVEIGVVASMAAILLAQKGRVSTVQGVTWGKWGQEEKIKREQPSSVGAPQKLSESPVQIRWGILFLLAGIVSSLIVATLPSAICPLSYDGLLRALGIVKSWFVFPILFGYILFRASEEYFSREKLIFVFLVSFIPTAILSLLGWLFGSDMTFDGRLSGIFNSPNALAMHLTPAIILSWYFFRKEKSNTLVPHSSLLAPLSLSLLFSLLFLTRSVSAWIAVLVGIIIFELFTFVIRRNGNKKTMKITYGLLFLFAILLAFSQWNNPRFENFFDPDSRSSFASRLMIWQSARKMIANSPVFGIGPGNFQSCYLAYQHYFPPYLEWSVPEPHHIFLSFWLGGGLFGLLAFCFLLFWWFQNISQSIQKKKDMLLLAVAAIMITTLIHGQVDTPYWRLGLSYMFWVVFFMGISSPCKGGTEKFTN